MIEGAEEAIKQIKQKAKKVPAMGRIQEGQHKGEQAPIPGKFRYEPPEAQAAINAWATRLLRIIWRMCKSQDSEVTKYRLWCG